MALDRMGHMGENPVKANGPEVARISLEKNTGSFASKDTTDLLAHVGSDISLLTASFEEISKIVPSLLEHAAKDLLKRFKIARDKYREIVEKANPSGSEVATLVEEFNALKMELIDFVPPAPDFKTKK